MSYLPNNDEILLLKELEIKEIKNANDLKQGLMFAALMLGVENKKTSEEDKIKIQEKRAQFEKHGKTLLDNADNIDYKYLNDKLSEK